MRKLLYVFLILTIYSLIGCSKPTEQNAEPPEGESGVVAETTPESGGKVITSTDGICQITAVGGWDSVKGLHKKAKLQASNPYKEMFLVVFTEKKDMFPDLTLEEHSKETVNNLMETMTGAYAKPSVQLTLNGNRALMNEVRGTAGNNMKIAYIHANIESPFYFHEVLAWTPDKRFKQNQYALDSVIKSFKEVKGSPAEGTSQP